MMVKSVLVTATLCAWSLATPVSSPHVVHEKRDAAPLGWMRKYALESRAILPINIALAQENIDRGYNWLMDVSRPENGKYGQHWNADDIVKVFAPRRV